ncbi:MAG: hypothetical protein Q7R34_14660 [Dehalococcoidia bacterium]|nr:hypothetical protein [Dehalococcoidia bacterium]
MGYLHHTGEGEPATVAPREKVVVGDPGWNDPDRIFSSTPLAQEEWPEGFSWALTQDNEGYPVAVSRVAWGRFPLHVERGMTSEEVEAHREAGWAVEEK